MSPELSPSAGLIERCALLPWPGNVRELQRELRSAAVAAQAQGAVLVQAEHLAADAGSALSDEAAEATPRERDLDDAAIERALAEHAGNVTAAAAGTCPACARHRDTPCIRRRLWHHARPAAFLHGHPSDFH